MCNSCSKPLRDSKYYEVIYRDARDHDKEKRIDDLSNDKEKKDEEESRKAEEHDKMIEELKNALRKLTSSELKEEEEKIRDEIAKLRAQLENPDEEDENKQSKSAMAEYIGVDAYHSVGRDVDTAVESLTTLQRHRKKKLKHSQSYNVLTLKPFESVTHSGDKLLIKLGSRDDDTVSDTSGDELLKSLGSSD